MVRYKEHPIGIHIQVYHGNNNVLLHDWRQLGWRYIINLQNFSRRVKFYELFLTCVLYSTSKISKSSHRLPTSPMEVITFMLNKIELFDRRSKIFPLLICEIFMVNINPRGGQKYKLAPLASPEICQYMPTNMRQHERSLCTEGAKWYWR